MTKRSSLLTAAAVGMIGTLALTACGGASQPGAGGDGEYVSGGTFRVAVISDPGSLVPMTATAPATWATISYAYESLISLDDDGEAQPWLAESWEESGTEVVYTLRDDVVCSDGTPLTAETVAANINYHADPANGSFYYGSQVSEAVSATADADTLTVTSETNDPFLLLNSGLILMVCQAGLDEPESLAEATAGTGLFELTDVLPQTAYTFTKRDDYTWGPDGVTSETEGLPDAVEVQVVTDQSTTANLLLAGDLNAGSVTTADSARLDGAGLGYLERRNPIGEILFNEREDRVTSDPLVREALSVAIDRDEVGEVVTDGTGGAAISLVNQPPMICVLDEPEWSLPDTDLERAGDLLDEAGWEMGADGVREKDGEPLEVKFIFDAGTDSHRSSAELLQQTWTEIGVTTNLTPNDSAAWSEQLYQTFDWDLGWVQIAPGSPVVLDTFFGGRTPDEGGLNFMFVDNPEYQALAQEAKQAESQEAACELWRTAETELIERTDVFPVADALSRTYMGGAEFAQTTYIEPTTIRMVG